MNILSLYERISSLCRAIRMPGAVSDALADFFRTTAADPDEPDHGLYCSLRSLVPALLDPSSAEKASDNLLERAGSKRGILILAVYLEAAAASREAVYAPAGISDSVFIDTMHSFSIFMEERLRAYQDTNFDRGFWCWRFTCGLEYRIGTLWYEMCPFSWEPGCEEIPEGTPILSVHIPSDSVLTRENILHSYRSAHAFFTAHFPDYRYAAACTFTWLLSPTLQTLLPEDSRILGFAADYRLLWMDPEKDDAVEWVFGRKDLPMEKLAENTSMQRKLKKLLAEGRQAGIAVGVLEKNGVRFSCDSQPF